MSHWDEFDLEAKIIQILRTAKGYPHEHHFGSPFLTTYQLAIAFAQNYPEDFRTITLPIGGEGVGQHNSLAQYLAGELSKRIKSGSITNIEGCFLSNQDLEQISFRNGDAIIISSLTDTQYPLSMYRLQETT